MPVRCDVRKSAMGSLQSQAPEVESEAASCSTRGPRGTADRGERTGIPTWTTHHQSVGDTPAERAGLKQAEEIKDNIIDLVLSARQRDEIWGEVIADARQRHEERCLKEAQQLEWQA